MERERGPDPGRTDGRIDARERGRMPNSNFHPHAAVSAAATLHNELTSCCEAAKYEIALHSLQGDAKSRAFKTGQKEPATGHN